MKRWILGLLLVVAVVGCGTSAEPPPKPTVVTKIIDGVPVSLGMVDGPDGKKVFFRMADAVQCSPEGCTSCDKGGCTFDSGCPCSNKGCSVLCNADALPGDPAQTEALVAPPATDDGALQKRLDELEKRVRELEASP